jgi:hypothetical protein
MYDLILKDPILSIFFLCTFTTMEMSLPNTRGGVLEETVKAQLHLDFVANPQLSCEQIINLPDREYKSQNAKAVRNRYLYLRNLKTNHPQHYWSLYSAANKAALSHPYSEDIVEAEIVEDPPSTPAAQSSREQRRWKTNSSPNLSTPPPSSNSKKTMSGSRATLSSPAALAFAYNTMFDTMEEAETAGMFSLIVLLLCAFFFSSF